jgi:hypothetical protein
MGILVLLFLLLLTITGVLINHSHEFGLDKKPVKSSVLLDYYQIKAPKTIWYVSPEFYAVENQLWINDQKVISTERVFISLLTWHQFYIAATDAQLFIFNQMGQMVDQLNIPLMFSDKLQQICHHQSQLIAVLEQQTVVSDEMLLDWQPIEQKLDAECAKPSPLDENQDIKQQIVTQYRSSFLSAEQVIQDIHSWRILGHWGKWLLDIIALIIILMSISGGYLWLRHYRSRH